MFWRHLVEPRASVSPTVMRVLAQSEPAHLPELPPTLATDGWRDVLVLYPTQAGHDARQDLETPTHLYALLRQLHATSTWRQVTEKLQADYQAAEITRAIRQAWDQRLLVLLARKTETSLDLGNFLGSSRLLDPAHLQSLAGPATSLASADPEALFRVMIDRGWLGRADANFLKRLHGMSRWAYTHKAR